MDSISKPDRTTPVTNSGGSSPTSPSLRRNPKAGEGSKSLSDLAKEADALTNAVAGLRISHSDRGVNSLETSQRKYLKVPPKLGDKRLVIKEIGGGNIGLDIDGSAPAPKRRAERPETDSPTKKLNSEET